MGGVTHEWVANVVDGKALLDKSEWRRSEIHGKNSVTHEWVALPTNGWRTLSTKKRYSTKASGDEAKYMVKVALPTNGWRDPRMGGERCRRKSVTRQKRVATKRNTW